MRPMKAVVVAANKLGIEVKLETGKLVTVLSTIPCYTGQKLLVAYDLLGKNVLKIVKEFVSEEDFEPPEENKHDVNEQDDFGIFELL